MNQVIMCVCAAGVLLGGLDRIFGNKRGYGKKLEEGFLLLGPTALSMVGIICLAPVLSQALGKVIIPLYQLIGVDPAMFGGLLAIDMGGYQMAGELALDPLLGKYSGIIVGAVFGCTVVFLIPVGMEIVSWEDRPLFAKGIMMGLIVMPVSLAVGGLVCGLSVLQILHQNVPVLMLALLLMLGLWKIPDAMVKGFAVFAGGIRVVVTIGLMMGAISYLTGITILPGLIPVEEAMEVVSAIGIVMLGSLPITELLVRYLKRPFTWLGTKCGMNESSVAGLLVCLVSVIPAITMLKGMDKRGKIVNVAYMVSAASMLAAHLGFTISAEPDMTGALLAAKLSGGAAAVAVSLFVTRKEKKEGKMA